MVFGRRTWWRENVDVLRTFVGFSHCLAESLGADRPEARAARPEVVGQQHVVAALAAGKGAILVTAHSGGWDVAAHQLGRDLNVPVLIVMAAEQDELARRLHDSVRVRAGVQVVHVGRHPLDALPVLQHLRRGGIVAFQLDRVPAGAPAVAVSLFERRIGFPRGPFYLASVARAPLVPIFSRRRGYFEYEICAAPAVDLGRRPSEAALEAAAQRAADAMQDFVARDPTQWFQFDPLTTPP
jgi:KDO2-lipid IV(A) lauroyltransferase